MDTNMQTQKRAIAIYCRTLNENDDPFSSDYYWQAYQDLMLALNERGVETYLVTGDSYEGDGYFKDAYTIDGKRKLSDLISSGEVKVDMVFDRGGFEGEGVLVINNPFVQKIGMNKIEMYKHFAKFQPLSVVCNDLNSVKEAFEQIETDKVVVKEPEGYGGAQVYIGTRKEVLPMLPEQYPLLVQEFLDTSLGVPGIAEGVHDVRLSMCGGELIGCYVRQARPGALHSNVAQGGKMLFMNVADAPTGPVQAAKEIDKLFASYPRYYSADFVNTPKGWKLLEINPLLALLPVTDGPEAVSTLNKLADYLQDVCEQVPKGL